MNSIPKEWNSITRTNGVSSGGGGSSTGKRKLPPCATGEDGEVTQGDNEGFHAPLNANGFHGGDMDLSVTSICQRISSNIQRSLTSSSQPIQLDINYILKQTPYRDLVQSLFSESSGMRPPEVKIVCRSYEESFMRERIHENEQLCMNGKNCEGNFIDPEIRFTCVRFILPGEVDPSSPGMCVLCMRKATQTLFYDMLYCGKSFRGVIQSFGNMCEKNEYRREDLLVCPLGAFLQCMPLPIVAHHRSKYQAVTWGGVKKFIQTLDTPKDF